MKKLLFTILLLISINVFGDEIQVPFSCYPKELQKQFSDRGYKLDLDGNERDKNSWGFIKNNGSDFSIFTYRAVTKEELKLIMEIVWQSLPSQQ